jgi:hypothetical protein
LEFTSAEEQAQRVTDSVHCLLQLAAAQYARQDFGDAHWAFANWKDHALGSARQGKKMFARERKLKVPNKILKVYLRCCRKGFDTLL